MDWTHPKVASEKNGAAGAQPVPYSSHLGVTVPQKINVVISFSALGVGRSLTALRRGGEDICGILGIRFSNGAYSTDKEHIFNPRTHQNHGDSPFLSTCHLFWTQTRKKSPTYWTFQKTDLWQAISKTWERKKNSNVKDVIIKRGTGLLAGANQHFTLFIYISHLVRKVTFAVKRL